MTAPDRIFSLEGAEIRVQSQAVPPFMVETAPNGAASVLDARGINWLKFGRGRALTTRPFAERVAAHLNENWS